MYVPLWATTNDTLLIHPLACQGPGIRLLTGLDESHCFPFQPSGPWRSLVSLSPHSHASLPTQPSPQSPLPLIYPLLPTTSLILLFSSPQGLVGLASTQSPSISSTSDIIRTEKSWEHSFPMILKWHHRHSGQAGWLVGQLAGWMTGWLAGPEKGELKCITYPD